MSQGELSRKSNDQEGEQPSNPANPNNSQLDPEEEELRQAVTEFIRAALGTLGSPIPISLSLFKPHKKETGND